MPWPRDPSPRTRWSRERLRRWIATTYGEESLVVLANREPFRHDLAADGAIHVHRSSGGLVTALEPLMEACSGVWVAHGSGSADRMVVDGRDGLDVPPASPLYRLRRVWLNAAEERGYYYGFANEGLWPLCHRAHVQPIFRSADFNTYREVNGRFVDAVCEEVETDQPVVLVQDYHFALAPRLIRQRLPASTIVTFWHIPWPTPREYAICPWRRPLLEGLLGSTIVGFQTKDDCDSFCDTVESVLDAAVDRARNVIVHDGVRTMVHAYPVSVEYPNQVAARASSVDACRVAMRRRFGLAPDVAIGIGIDRLDYTKGISEKFLAVEQLLELHPEFVKRLVFVQVAEPSRECLPAYREMRCRLQAIADRVNRRLGADDYRPIVLLEAHHEPAEVFQFMRGADFCYVGSLHDGMNLVAKEFVNARDDERGVLVLSEFAGAARELTAALIVNPYAIDEAAQTLAKALTMPHQEQSMRMRNMRSVIAEFNAYRWAAEMLSDAARVRHDSADFSHEFELRSEPRVLHA